jgi:hypothetical protein
MVASADNLNLDVLEHICSFCADPDIFSVILVSRSFFLAALPRMYSVLSFSVKHAKRYPRVTTLYAQLTVGISAKTFQ